MPGAPTQRCGSPGPISADRRCPAQRLGQGTSRAQSHDAGLALRKSRKSLARALPHSRPGSIQIQNHLPITMKTFIHRVETDFDAPLSAPIGIPTWRLRYSGYGRYAPQEQENRDGETDVPTR